MIQAACRVQLLPVPKKQHQILAFFIKKKKKKSFSKASHNADINSHITPTAPIAVSHHNVLTVLRTEHLHTASTPFASAVQDPALEDWMRDGSLKAS